MIRFDKTLFIVLPQFLLCCFFADAQQIATSGTAGVRANTQRAPMDTIAALSGSYMLRDSLSGSYQLTLDSALRAPKDNIANGDTLIQTAVDELILSEEERRTADSLSSVVQTTGSATALRPDLEPEYKHSPHKASIFAAVVPGAGQIYNKKYWKLPILYGGIGALVYAINFNTTYYDKYRSAYRDFLIRDPGNTSYEEFIPPGLDIDAVQGQYADWFQRSLQNKKRYYKRSRDLSYIGMAAIYLISIIDASVDAHFYDFDISDDLSLKLEPAIVPAVQSGNATFGFQMRIGF